MLDLKNLSIWLCVSMLDGVSSFNKYSVEFSCVHTARESIINLPSDVDKTITYGNHVHRIQFPNHMNGSFSSFRRVPLYPPSARLSRLSRFSHFSRLWEHHFRGNHNMNGSSRSDGDRNGSSTPANRKYVRRNWPGVHLPYLLLKKNLKFAAPRLIWCCWNRCVTMGKEKSFECVRDAHGIGTQTAYIAVCESFSTCV